jgi:hypothetical protein
MIPRLKLIQCFTCKNNLECWGLKEDIPLGLNERTAALTPRAFDVISKEISKDESLSIGDQYGILSMMFFQEMRFDKQIVKRDVFQIIFMLAALSNSTNDDWVCPAEDPESDESFVYEARE